jgi:LmbE family N-acetylglucosaminyl deacetylase
MGVPDFNRRLALAAATLQLIVSGPAGPTALGVRYLPNQRDVVVVAHQDDWQVFMGDVIAKRIQAGDSATFIYLTAGDDGRDSLYWQTRELAALQSTRIAAGRQTGSRPTSCSRMQVRGHSIQECLTGDIKSYFLRLPDGKRDGAGFRRQNYQSLRKLRGRKIAAIGAVDGSASYSGWEDLMATVSELIDRGLGVGEITIHTTDPGIAANPHDHFDHRMTGLLVADLRKARNWNTRYYVGYALASRAPNRSADQAREKTAIFLAYDREMMRVNKRWSAYAEHPAFYSQCMLRTYARTAPVPRVRQTQAAPSVSRERSPLRDMH